ncbi:DAR GTPase 2, mitochondrial isoform X2 [Apium graveolens]|uniref:DAR GTPase 2, mitochondrial isoform X2 n=1 Tax=Apium graveolens TaxID=4045 RepID=UPI003D79FFC0
MAGRIVLNIGKTIKKVVEKKGSSWWYTPHMAAASRAIANRIPLVDIVVQVRDARIPFSSTFEHLNVSNSSKQIILLNKMDLANRSQTKKWTRYLEEQRYVCCEVNSHNKESIKGFLNLLQSEVKELKRNGQSSHTTTVMLVGIPNSGKSALANALHQIGRISAEEKGRLKHAAVSPNPGETKEISSFKIASHPNIFVLDTPGVLPPDIIDDEVCSKLALTGAIADSLVGELKLAQYFLAILSTSEEYKKWVKLPRIKTKILTGDQQGNYSTVSEGKMGPKKHVPDHTQDSIVNDVRRTLFETVSSFSENLEDGENFAELYKLHLMGLHKAFQVVPGIGIAALSEISVSSTVLNKRNRIR